MYKNIKKDAAYCLILLKLLQISYAMKDFDENKDAASQGKLRCFTNSLNFKA